MGGNWRDSGLSQDREWVGDMGMKKRLILLSLREAFMEWGPGCVLTTVNLADETVDTVAVGVRTGGEWIVLSRHADQATASDQCVKCKWLLKWLRAIMDAPEGGLIYWDTETQTIKDELEGQDGEGAFAETPLIDTLPDVPEDGGMSEHQSLVVAKLREIASPSVRTNARTSVRSLAELTGLSWKDTHAAIAGLANNHGLVARFAGTDSDGFVTYRFFLDGVPDDGGICTYAPTAAPDTVESPYDPMTHPWKVGDLFVVTIAITPEDEPCIGGVFRVCDVSRGKRDVVCGAYLDGSHKYPFLSSQIRPCPPPVMDTQSGPVAVHPSPQQTLRGAE